MTDKQKNYARAKAIERKNKERILAVCSWMEDRTGIYKFYRTNEDGKDECYIGKAEKQGMVTRCAQHIAGYKQHIDKSIQAHGFYSEDKPLGWRVMPMEYCEPQMCDELERYYIVSAIARGRKVLNVESGGTTDKTDINERKPSRGYRDGVKQGEKNVIKKIAHWFDLHLKAVYKADKPSKNAIKALDKFNQILQGETDND